MQLPHLLENFYQKKVINKSELCTFFFFFFYLQGIFSPLFYIPYPIQIWGPLP